MFTMDIPYAPIQDATIVLAQAAVSGTGSNTKQPDYLLKTCDEFSSNGGGGVTPAAWLAVYLGNRDHRDIYDDQAALASIKITLLDAPKHGTFTSDSTGQGYFYVPEPGYLGNDKAVFMTEFEGKYYKIVANIIVSVAINDIVPLCPAPTLIKLNPKPVSGSLGINLGAITLNIANLPGGAVGQTVGTAITLDTNAAGDGWYIDPNPAANTDFLPTSNPNVWIAKAGSASRGKMHASDGSEILWLQVR